MPSCLSGIFPFSSSLLGFARSTPRIRNSSHGGYYSRNPFAAESAFEKVSLELLLLFRQEVVLDVGAEQFVSRASFRHRLSPPQTTLPRCLFRPSLHRSEKSGQNIQPLRANNNRRTEASPSRSWAAVREWDSQGREEFGSHCDTALKGMCENSIEHVEDWGFFSVTPVFSPVPVRGRRPETVLTVFPAVRGNR